MRLRMRGLTAAVGWTRRGGWEVSRAVATWKTAAARSTNAEWLCWCTSYHHGFDNTVVAGTAMMRKWRTFLESEVVVGVGGDAP